MVFACADTGALCYGAAGESAQRIKEEPRVAFAANRDGRALQHKRFPGNNVKYHHSIFRHQAHIPVTGTEATLRLRFRVECGADFDCVITKYWSLWVAGDG